MTGVSLVCVFVFTIAKLDTEIIHHNTSPTNEY